MPAPRPEFDVCRVCGYDISKRDEEYLLCPECGAANNRLMAARDTAVFGRGLALRITLGALAALGGVILTSCGGAGSSLWLWAPLGMVTGFCASFIVMTLCTPATHRKRGFAMTLVWSAVFGAGGAVAVYGSLALFTFLAKYR